MTILISILSFAFTLGVIVLLHELGHFLVAKAFGVRVLTFSIGFGNRIAGFERNGTDYRISALPLGGYVRMGGEQPEDATGDPQDFVTKPRWQRIVIYLAGPAMNLVLSVGVMAVLFMIGIYVQALQDLPPELGRIEAGSAGERAGLEAGDRIVAVDGQPVHLWKDFAFIVATSAERELKLDIERAGRRQDVRLTPAKEKVEGYGEAGLIPKLRPMVSGVASGRPAAAAGFQAGDAIVKADGQPINDVQQFIEIIEARPGRQLTVEVSRQVAEKATAVSLEVTPAAVEGKGRIGIELGYFRRLPLGEAIVESWRYNLELVGKTLEVVKKLFLRELDFSTGVSGPLKMGEMAGEAAKQGAPSLFLLMAFLSISIGVLNLLPIPLLDGGQIFILLVESVLRRDLPMRFKERFAQVGFMILMVLMATVIFFDLSKMLPSLFAGGK